MWVVLAIAVLVLVAAFVFTTQRTRRGGRPPRARRSDPPHLGRDR
jgi:hypothetical protein